MTVCDLDALCLAPAKDLRYDGHGRPRRWHPGVCEAKAKCLTQEERNALPHRQKKIGRTPRAGHVPKPKTRKAYKIGDVAPWYGKPRIYVGPGHELAQRTGWVGINRLTAYNHRAGVCACDACGDACEWADVKVLLIDRAGKETDPANLTTRCSACHNPIGIVAYAERAVAGMPRGRPVTGPVVDQLAWTLAQLRTLVDAEGWN